MITAGRQNHKIDEEDYQCDCLARYICNLEGGLDARRTFLNKMEKRHGKQFTDELKVRVTNEWDRRHSLDNIGSE